MTPAVAAPAPAESVPAEPAPAVAVPLGTAPADTAGAPTTTYVPPTKDVQQPLPALPIAQTETSPSGEILPPSDDQANYEHTDDEYHGEHEYVGVLGSYVIPDEHRDTTRHGGGFSLIYGHLFNQHLSLEVNPAISVFNTGKDKGTDFYEYGGTVDLAYGFTSRTQSAITPFILAGVGGDYEDVQPSSGKKGTFSADAGLGLVSAPFFYGIKFRIEGRFVYDFDHQFERAGYHDYRASAGFEIPLGRVVRTIKLAPRPVEVVQTVPRPWIDSDGDGVDDEHDKCPGTPKGFKVDSDGCIIPGQTIVLHGITFEFNKDRLTPNAKALLDTIVPAFTGQASLHMEVGGHTDSIGSEAYNLGLSQRRAESVRAYLVNQGAHPEQIVAKGYGKTQLLINPEKTSDDRELNRRVEFKVLEK
jgi:OOP family OmpA-OmpF porin